MVAQNLAACLSWQKKHPEAEELQRGILASWKRLKGAAHLKTLAVSDDLRISLNNQAKFGEVEQLQREVVAVAERVHGVEHRGTLTAQHHLAISLYEQAKFASAEQLLRKVLCGRKHIFSRHILLDPATCTLPCSGADVLSAHRVQPRLKVCFEDSR